MLFLGQDANEMFSPDREGTEALSQGGVAPCLIGLRAWDQAGASKPGREEDVMATAAIRPGDQVVFERLDLAEALGIWRHARGRIIGIHGHDGGSATVDVEFEGHAVLERYLPDLFRRVH